MHARESGLNVRMRILATVLLVLGSGSATASQLEELAQRAGIAVIAPGRSDRATEDSARDRLPLKQLSRENLQRANTILNQTSQYRRLPEVSYQVDRPLYTYLVHHPDVAVSTWRAMGISRFQMWQTGPLEFEAAAGDGSEGIADILYRDAGQCLFICEGRYQNALLPRPIIASVLVLFQYSFSADTPKGTLVRQSADVFVSFPSQSVATIAKVLTPVTNSLLDRNLFEVTLYSCMMSRAVLDEPDWVVLLAQQLDGVLPARPKELVAIARMDRGRRRAAIPPRRPGPVAANELLTMGIQFFEPPGDLLQSATEAPPQTPTETTRDATGSPSPVSSTPVSLAMPGGSSVSGSNQPAAPPANSEKPAVPSSQSTVQGPPGRADDDAFQLQNPQPPKSAPRTVPTTTVSSPSAIPKP